jgi:hypothetical protein
MFNNVVNYSLPSVDEWCIAQKEDKNLNIYITYIKENKLPEDDNLALEVLRKSSQYSISNKGLLCHNSKKNIDRLPRICVPEKYRRLVLEEYHDSLWSGGHFGKDKTIEKIKRIYYFKNLYQYVELWCKSCTICNSVKKKNANSNESIPKELIETREPWDLVCIDLWKAGVKSEGGNKYILTVIDGFSKFALAIPIKSKKATVVAKALLERVFSIFGFPLRLHSDQGKEFVNEILEELCKLNGIKKSTTTAYHPQGNAYAERIHQFFRNMLTAYIRIDQRNWDDIIPFMMIQYQTCARVFRRTYSE